MSDTSVEWEQSPTVGALFAALAKAQGEIESATKSADNPFFKSKYADLAAIRDACKPLSKYELAIVQMPFTRGNQIGVRTQMGHASGEWLACIALTTPKDGGPQAFGSCATYLRRYSLAAFACVATEDDDGEKAEGRDKNKKPPGANWSTPRNDSHAAGDTITTATLHALRSAALTKMKKGAEAKKWLAENFQTDDAEKLTEVQGQRALQLLAS